MEVVDDIEGKINENYWGSDSGISAQEYDEITEDSLENSQNLFSDDELISDDEDSSDDDRFTKRTRRPKKD